LPVLQPVMISVKKIIADRYFFICSKFYWYFSGFKFSANIIFFYSNAFRRISRICFAAFATEVPGPKIAATPVS